MQILGVHRVVAAVLIAEIGIDIARGSKRAGMPARATSTLRTILLGAATSASRTKGRYLKDKYHRLKARRGALRAALTIAHKILSPPITSSPKDWHTVMYSTGSIKPALQPTSSAGRNGSAIQSFYNSRRLPLFGTPGAPIRRHAIS
jgi:hypothetical protein